MHEKLQDTHPTANVLYVNQQRKPNFGFPQHRPNDFRNNANNNSNQDNFNYNTNNRDYQTKSRLRWHPAMMTVQ